MAHLSHKHFNSYKEGVNLEFLRDYCIEHGETRLMKRGEVFEKAGEPSQLVAFVERGCCKYMVHNGEERKDIVQALLLRVSLWLTIRIAFLARSQR